MSRGPRGRRIDSGVAVVTLNGSGAGTAAVVFAETDFFSPPAILVVPDAADAAAGATFTATSQTKDGFTISISGSNQTSGDVEVVWFACEKG